MGEEMGDEAGTEVCSFCGKATDEADEAVKLIKGPGVNICDACVYVCAEVVMQSLGARSGSMERVQEFATGGGPKGDAVPACSFCEKSHKEVAKLITGPGANICNECVDLCGEIIKEYRLGELRVLEGGPSAYEGAESEAETDGAVGEEDVEAVRKARQLRGCSFCGESQAKVTALFATPAASLCDQCLKRCDDLMELYFGQKPEGKLVYVAPAGERFGLLYEEHLRPMAEGLNLNSAVVTCEAGNDRALRRMWIDLAASSMIVVDVTGRLSTALFALGYACGRGGHVYVVGQDGNDIALDWIPAEVRRFAYQTNREGFDLLAKCLSPYVESCMRDLGLLG